MIPRTIHYCWFGRGAMPELALRCLDSWRRHMPDCAIVQWDENTFDVNRVAYTREAYRLRKYAYVSDYARLWVLYHHGGIYLDTDVELLRPLDDMLQRGAFMGRERPERADDPALHCAMGLGVACGPGNPFVKRLLDHYSAMHLVSRTGKMGDTIVAITGRLLEGEPQEPFDDGIVRCAGFNIYPWPWLCPRNYFTGALDRRPETHAIHHYAASWVDDLAHETWLDKLRRRAQAALVRLT